MTDRYRDGPHGIENLQAGRCFWGYVLLWAVSFVASILFGGIFPSVYIFIVAQLTLVLCTILMVLILFGDISGRPATWILFLLSTINVIAYFLAAWPGWGLVAGISG
jgi:hypothetical protein